MLTLLSELTVNLHLSGSLILFYPILYTCLTQRRPTWRRQIDLYVSPFHLYMSMSPGWIYVHCNWKVQLAKRVSVMSLFNVARSEGCYLPLITWCTLITHNRRNEVWHFHLVHCNWVWVLSEAVLHKTSQAIRLVNIHVGDCDFLSPATSFSVNKHKYKSIAELFNV